MYSKNVKAKRLPDGSGSYPAFGLGTTSVQQVQQLHNAEMLKATKKIFITNYPQQTIANF